MILSSSGKKVSRRMLIGAVALLVPVLAGCEAGTDAPTLQFHNANIGANKVVNGITISDAFVLAGPDATPVPAGSPASFFVGLFNANSNDDTLESVSTNNPSSSATITGGSVTIPSSGSANLTGPEPQIVLSGLPQSLSPGGSISVTLDFAHAGSVQLDVPIEPNDDVFANYSQPPTPAPSTTAPTAPGASSTPTGSTTPTAPASPATGTGTATARSSTSPTASSTP